MIDINDAITVADSVLINEQAALLRECRAALDGLLSQRPMMGRLYAVATHSGISGQNCITTGRREFLALIAQLTKPGNDL